MAHAELGPSAAHRWIRCQGAIVLSQDLPDITSEFAAEGSVGHEIGDRCLRLNVPANTFLGETLEHDGFTFLVTQDMADHVQNYVDYVLRIGGNTMAEQKLPISHLTGEADAHGTADAVVIQGRTMHICDLKYGMGVRVLAEHNEQLQMYALAALHQYDSLGDFDTVVLHIIQPRLDHYDSWEVSVSDLLEFAEDIKLAAQWVAEAKVKLEEKHFVVGDKQCKFCPAKASCPALAQYVFNTVRDDFTDLTQPITDLNENREMDNQSLGHVMAAIPMVEEFCKAIRARVERELFDGKDVPGFKLVEGRRGARKWTDQDAVATALGELAWEQSLISPTTAEKLLKKTELWEAIQSLITQSEGKPSVAPTSDKRPAISAGVTADDFN
jgi:Protein of unknown function (DUF2800)